MAWMLHCRTYLHTPQMWRRNTAVEMPIDIITIISPNAMLWLDHEYRVVIGIEDLLGLFSTRFRKVKNNSSVIVYKLRNNLRLHLIPLRHVSRPAKTPLDSWWHEEGARSRVTKKDSWPKSATWLLLTRGGSQKSRNEKGLGSQKSSDEKGTPHRQFNNRATNNSNQTSPTANQCILSRPSSRRQSGRPSMYATPRSARCRRNAHRSGTDAPWTRWEILKDADYCWLPKVKGQSMVGYALLAGALT